MKYDMIIFDIDGTLWNVAKITMEAVNMAAKILHEKCKVSLQDINSIMGLGINDVAEKLYSNIDHQKAVEIIKKSIDISEKLIKERAVYIYDDVSDTIKYLSTKYKLGIVTNNTDNYCKLFLNKSELNNYFNDYIGASTYGINKSDAIKRIVSRNNIKKSCYIGDIKKDMESAKEANVDFIHAKYGFEPTLNSYVYINSIKELKLLL